MNTTIIIIIVIGIYFITLLIIGKYNKNSKLGINLNRVYCPKCNLKQPIIRRPSNERETLYGGYTCEKCKTKMDKFGVEIKH